MSDSVFGYLVGIHDKYGVQFIVAWTPSHSGLFFNEMADVVASEVTEKARSARIDARAHPIPLPAFLTVLKAHRKHSQLWEHSCGCPHSSSFISFGIW